MRMKTPAKTSNGFSLIANCKLFFIYFNLEYKSKSSKLHKQIYFVKKC